MIDDFAIFVDSSRSQLIRVHSSFTPNPQRSKLTMADAIPFLYDEPEPIESHLDQKNEI